MDPAAEYEKAVIEQHRALVESTGSEESPIQTFFKDAVIFVTGGSGYMGKQMIEKLFRTCAIKKVYLLLRPKKGKSVRERMDTLFKDPVYNVLREMKPNFDDHIEIVEGDIAEIRLGLTDQHWDKIVEEVEVCINGAATINFNQPLASATLINVRGTREMLSLGRACKKLRAFIHLSTAFSHATVSRTASQVDEIFYPSPIPPNTLIDMAEKMDEGRIDTITPKLITDWPNTYTFTKAVAEELIRNSNGEFPIAIVRPGIVLGSYREPTPGWVDLSISISGPPGVTLGPSLGIIHVQNVDREVRLGITTVDFANNGIIAAAYETYRRWNIGEKDIKIYTLASTRNSMETGKWLDLMKVLLPKIASPKTLWYGFGFMTKHKWVYLFFHWYWHMIPAYVVDTLVRHEISLVRIYKKFDKVAGLLSHFLLTAWTLDDKNTLNMYTNLSEKDKVIYNFDFAVIDWHELIRAWYIGQRRYIIKDGLKGTEIGVRNQKLMMGATVVIGAVYTYALYKIFAILIYVLMTIFNYIF